MTRTGCCALLLFFFFFAVYSQSPAPSGFEVAQLMFEHSARIQSLTYTITKQERVEGKILKQISFTKMQKSPYSVYLRQSFPNDGMEVLYVRGANSDKALINPNGFPWINLKLDPLDGIMRNNQHHTIFQSGFDHVVSILEFLCDKYQSQIDEMVVYNGLLTHEGKDCHSITFINPYFKLVDYTMQANETIEDVAAQKKLSAHMILESNPKIKDYEDVEVGQVIQIPNDYSPKLNLIIDAQAYIPLKMEVIDGKGLYEQYEYSKVVINPSFDPKEFTESYNGYGF